MGRVHVNATIRGTHSMRLRFLVDTGATYNLISPETARRAGIEPGPIRDRMRLATGRAVRVPTGLGAIRIDGREAATIFWIGPCEEPSLGVETLEALGLAVDPREGAASSDPTLRDPARRLRASLIRAAKLRHPPRIVGDTLAAAERRR